MNEERKKGKKEGKKRLLNTNFGFLGLFQILWVFSTGFREWVSLKPG